MQKLIQLKLKILSKLILKKYKPKIIGITGSVGKTSTREAIFTVLNKNFKTRESIKNYNNEIGVPLTIINADAPGKSLFLWIGVFLKAIKLLLLKDSNYPNILILEMGIDRPGDMDYLMNITRCDIGVITMIGSSHAEYFSSISKIKEEKEILIQKLKNNGYGVLNFDNDKNPDIKIENNKIISYGLKEGADVFAYDINYNNPQDDIENLSGISFKVRYNEKEINIELPKVIGLSAIYAALAGISVGIIMEIDFNKIKENLKNFTMPKGRMNAMKGVKHTLIIDDTYNASPQSSISAIDYIEKIKIPGKKWAVLGDMLELGLYTKTGHIEVGKKLFENKFDKLITIGEKSIDIANGAKEAGMKKEDIDSFSKNKIAGRFLQEKIKQGDLIFIKGSQGARMEQITKEIMAEPLKHKELLVRQEDKWQL